MTARAAALRGNAAKRRTRVADSHSDVPPASTPWKFSDYLLNSHPHYGQFGDPTWKFGKQAPNHQANHCDVAWGVGPTKPWPSPGWAAVGRDFGMALLGRRPDRNAPVTGARKPVTVHRMLIQLSVIARWAEANDLGLPTDWDETVGPRLLRDAREDRLLRRHTARSTSDASVRLYLDVLSELWMHRKHIVHGPTAHPWPNYSTTSSTNLVTGGARVAVVPAVSSEVIEPAVWWALIRFALRFVVVYSPDLIPAWKTYIERLRNNHQRSSNAGRANLGPETLARVEAFAANPASLVPLNADGTANRWQLVPLIGVTTQAWGKRNRYAGECAAVIERMVEAGRITRYWFGQVSDVQHSDGSRGPWVDHLDVTNLANLVGRLTDACYIVIGALGALRDSETQGLQRGCVTISDGGLALAGDIIKGNEQPENAIWWIDPLVGTCVKILEDLAEGMQVTDTRDGALTESDRLFWRPGGGPGIGRAGLGAGSAVLKQTISWINENADTFDLPRAYGGEGPAIPVDVSPHQLRTTFAAVAAMEPDGPLGVAAQLHDTFTVAAAYMANEDRKWLDVHRAHRDQVTVARLRRYLDGAQDNLCGPGATGLRADLHITLADAAELSHDSDDYEGLVDSLLLAAGRSIGTSNLSHCRGRLADARCATIFGGLYPDEAFTPNFEADVCFGTTAADDCRNVVYDPPDHLPVWDVALTAYRNELAALPEQREASRTELTRLISSAEIRIAAMERACMVRPQPVLTRLLRELERYLDYLRFDIDIPGSAAQYRPLYLSTQRRIHWLREQMPKDQRPDWALPVVNYGEERP